MKTPVGIPAAPAGRPESAVTASWRTGSDEPLVSVICHTYNHAAYLRDSVHGFLAQRTDFPFEIIIRDDASTDGTGLIATELARLYPRIVRVLVEPENRYASGIMPSVSTFPLARGRFIAMCEGDDYWFDPDKLQRQVECLERHPAAGLAVHPSFMIYDDNGVSGNHEIFCSHGAVETTLPVAEIFRRNVQFAPTSSYLLRAECVPDWLAFMSQQHPTYGDFFLECIASRGEIAYLPAVMSVYRRGHAGSFSSRQRQMNGASLLASFQCNVAATRALSSCPGVTENDIRQRLALLRQNCLRQLVRIGAFGYVAALVKDGPIAAVSTGDRILLLLCRAPWLARIAWRSRRWMQGQVRS